MIELCSSELSLVVSPEQGGAITSIYSRSTKDEWLFFDKTRRVLNASLDCYDDVWCGGFEELFPNDAAGTIQNRRLKDHGELWQQSWDVKRRTDRTVEMEIHCQTVPAVVKKQITVESEKRAFRIEYSLQNTGVESYPYLFKLHPAMRVEAGDEILLPGGDIIPVDLTFSSIIGTSGPFTWPTILSKKKEQINLSIVPEKGKTLQEFIYVKNLAEGWCGLKRKKTGERFILSYPEEIFPFCWFFMALGGWRDYYTIVMEPCTNFPKDMNAAMTNGTCAIMAPNEIRKFSVSASLS